MSSAEKVSRYSDLGTFEYGYDNASNVLSALQTATMDELDADRYYEYDTLNRLTEARLTDTQDWDAAVEATTTYQYDDLSNRESHSYRDAAAITYAHDKANRMTTYAGNNQDYDKAGNLTLAYSADRATSYKYKYDHNNRLTGIYDDGGTTQSAAFAYDALGRRIEFIDDKPATSATTRYYYDGVNEIVETDQSANNRRTYVHGISYVDERLMMMDFGDPSGPATDDRPYYYVIDRMYNVRFIVDRAGAIVERWCYDSYGRPLIRESVGRGDMDNDTDMDSTDVTRFLAVYNGTKWDPRADLDDDGDVDASDRTLYNSKNDNWPPQSTATVVAQAFSDAGNPFGFQGRVHFAIDTAAAATDATLFLVDHRWRMNDPVTGRWLTRDPLDYIDGMSLYEYLMSNTQSWNDPFGTSPPTMVIEGCTISVYYATKITALMAAIQLALEAGNDAEVRVLRANLARILMDALMDCGQLTQEEAARIAAQHRGVRGKPEPPKVIRKPHEDPYLCKIAKAAFRAGCKGAMAPRSCKGESYKQDDCRYFLAKAAHALACRVARGAVMRYCPNHPSDPTGRGHRQAFRQVRKVYKTCMKRYEQCEKWKKRKNKNKDSIPESCGD